LQLECDIYNRYDVTIAICGKEADVMNPRTQNTRIVTIPTTRSPVMSANAYSRSPWFSAGGNPFNVHGHYYFCSARLPQVRASIPEFLLNVYRYNL
jgi:hypothetical protein